MPDLGPCGVFAAVGGGISAQHPGLSRRVEKVVGYPPLSELRDVLVELSTLPLPGQVLEGVRVEQRLRRRSSPRNRTGRSCASWP